MAEIEFVFGEETFEVSSYVENTITPYAPGERDIFEGQFDINSAIQSTASHSLFSEKKIIILKNPWFLKRAMSDNELQSLDTFMTEAKKSPFHVLIYNLGAVDQRKKTITRVKKQAKTIIFAPFKDWEQDKILHWVMNYAKKTGKKMDQKAALALEEIGGSDLRQLASEIQKCAVYVGERPTISAEDIQSLCAPQSASIFDLNQAMKKNKTTDILKNIHHLIKQGEDAIKLMGLISANYRLYLQLLLLKFEGKSLDECGRRLGKNSFFLKTIMTEIQSVYTIPKLKQALIQAADADMLIKTGKMKPELAVSRVILKESGS